MSVKHKYFKVFPQLQLKLYFMDYFAFLLLFIGTTNYKFQGFLKKKNKKTTYFNKFWSWL